MTAAGGHMNQPNFSIETPHSCIPPPGFLVFTCLGFTSFEAPGQRSVDFPCRHSNSQHHQMSRELVDHNGARQRALLSQPLPSGEQRRQDRRGENIFC